MLGWTGRGENGLPEWANRKKIGIAVEEWEEARRRKAGEKVEFVPRGVEKQDFKQVTSRVKDRDVSSRSQAADRDYHRRDRQRDRADRDSYRDRDERGGAGSARSRGDGGGDDGGDDGGRRGGRDREDDKHYRKRRRSRSLSRERGGYRYSGR